MKESIKVNAGDLVEIEVTVRMENAHGDCRKVARSKIGFRCENGNIPRETWDKLTSEQSEYLLNQLKECQ